MDRPTFLSSGEQARLIPVGADTAKEARAVSILLATLTSVPPFARAMLQTLGQRVGTRARLDCFTEVVFNGNGGEVKTRPDGLIVVDGGRGRQWHCLVEAKIGRAELDEEQLTRYCVPLVMDVVAHSGHVATQRAWLRATGAAFHPERDGALLLAP